MQYQWLKELVEIDSPSGYTHEAANYVKSVLTEMGYSPSLTNKGAVVCNLGEQPELVVAAHIDTLGGIVSKINSDGTLRISKVGGPSLNAYEGCYVRVRTLDDKVINGTFLINNPSVHVNAKLGSTERSPENMHVRLDELVENEKDVKKLGINIGDFVCFEPYYTESESGYIKSKFMDNKASCYVLLQIAKLMKDANQTAPVQLFFSNYEEVGHGASSGYADTIKDMLCLDMGVVGDGCAGTETACSICAKDSTGPYDYGFRKQLVELCEKNNIPYKLDIYPFYGSDGSAALRAGHNFKVALIGMGVSASHGVERTHKKGVEATVDLCMAYIKNRFS